jgi:saposin
LVQNSTEQDFKELLLDLCTEIGFLVDQCRDVVDQYYVALYDWLVHQFQPKAICQDIGLCPGKELDSVNVWPMVPAGTGDMLMGKEPAIHPQIIDKGGLTKDGPLEEDATWFKDEPHIVRVSLETSGLHISPQIKPLSGLDVVDTLPQLPLERFNGPLEAAGSESCAICQTVMHEVENVLMDGQTVDEIKTIVDGICEKLPDTITNECKGFVDRYGSLLIALLAQKFDPATVCPKLKLCPEGLDIQIVSLSGAEFPKTVAYDLAEARNEVQMPAESVTCVVCEYAIGILQQALNDNTTQAEVRQVLDSLCDRMPDAVAGECILLDDAYSEELIDAMILDLTPEQTCRYLMLCRPPHKEASVEAELANMEHLLDFDVLAEDLTSPKKVESAVEFGASPGCILCEFVMERAETMLKDNKTEENIEDTLRRVCQVMPKPVRADCNNFIDQYFKAVVDTLDHLPPSEVCGAIALCSRPRPKEKQQKLKGNFKCTICKDVMKLLKEVLMDSRIDEKISEDFQKLCSYLPRSVSKKHRSQCHDIMEHYGPYVVHMLASLEKPEELCSYIDMCDAVPGLVKIDPNFDHCSLGPKYFCAKKKRAELCNKEDFCRNEIWKKDEVKKRRKFRRSFDQD